MGWYTPNQIQTRLSSRTLKFEPVVSELPQAEAFQNNSQTFITFGQTSDSTDTKMTKHKAS